MNKIAKTFGVLILAFGIILATGTTGTIGPGMVAHADTVAATPIHTLTNPTWGELCQADGNSRITQAKGCLPLWRWKEATSGFHSDLESGIVSAIVYGPDSAIQSMLYAMSGAIWSVTISISEWASNLDILKSAGVAVDKGAATLGNAIISSPILAALMGILVFAALWRAYRGGGNTSKGAWMPILRSTLVIALLAATVTGATATTSTKFGFLSPAYMATMVSDIIGSTSSMLASAIFVTQSEQDARGYQDAQKGGDCGSYTALLKSYYMERTTNSSGYVSPPTAGGQPSAGNPATEDGGQTLLLNDAFPEPDALTPFTTSSAASVPLALNQMWEQTALSAWKRSQFGIDEEMANRAYCHMLEERVNTEPKVEAWIFLNMRNPQDSTLAKYPNLADPDLNAVAFNRRNGDDYSRSITTSMVGWAACRVSDGTEPTSTENRQGSNWVWDSTWWSARELGIQDKGGDADKVNCSEWWSSPVEGGSPPDWSHGNALTVGQSLKSHNQFIPGYAEGQNFTGHLNGASRASSMVVPWINLASALVIMAIFGIVAAIVVLAKVAVAVYALLAVAAFALSLVPGNLGKSVLNRYVKSFLGYTIIAFGYSTVLGLLILVTNVIQDAAKYLMGGFGSIPYLLMSAIAPLVAFLSLSFMFKKVLKAPNPLSFKGMMGLGAAGAAVGGAASGFSKLKNMGKGDKDKGKGGSGKGGTRGGSAHESPNADDGMAGALNKGKQAPKRKREVGEPTKDRMDPRQDNQGDKEPVVVVPVGGTSRGENTDQSEGVESTEASERKPVAPGGAKGAFSLTGAALLRAATGINVLNADTRNAWKEANKRGKAKQITKGLATALGRGAIATTALAAAPVFSAGAVALVSAAVGGGTLTSTLATKRGRADRAASKETRHLLRQNFVKPLAPGGAKELARDAGSYTWNKVSPAGTVVAASVVSAGRYVRDKSAKVAKDTWDGYVRFAKNTAERTHGGVQPPPAQVEPPLEPQPQPRRRPQAAPAQPPLFEYQTPLEVDSRTRPEPPKWNAGREYQPRLNFEEQKTLDVDTPRRGEHGR